MRPLLPVDYQANMSASDVKHFSQSYLRMIAACIESSYLNNLWCSQFMGSAKLALAVLPSALSKRVMNVFFLSSYAKVARVAATTLPNAVVKNLLIIGNHRPVFGYPSELGRSNLVESTRASYGHNAVTINIHSALPKPAIIWMELFYFGPESFLDAVRKKLREPLRGNSFVSHSISFVDCLTRPRLNQQREGTFIFGDHYGWRN